MSETIESHISAIDESYRREIADLERRLWFAREAMLTIMESAHSVSSSVVETIATNGLRAIGALPK